MYILYVIYFVFLFLSGSSSLYSETNDQEIKAWSLDTSRGDFLRNQQCSSFFEKEKSKPDLRTSSLSNQVLTLSMSSESSIQASALNSLAMFLAASNTVSAQNKLKITGNSVVALTKFFHQLEQQIEPSDIRSSKFLDKVKRWENFETLEVAFAKSCARSACQPGATSEDIGAFKEAFALMSPIALMRGYRGRPVVSLLRTWGKVVSDPLHHFAAINIAKNLLAKVNLHKTRGIYPEGSLFEDLKSEFEKLTPDEARAEEMVFDLLGAYSTRGVDVLALFEARWPSRLSLISKQLFSPFSLVVAEAGTLSIPSRSFRNEPFVEKQNVGIFVALATIATCITYLDTAAVENNSPLYSLPKNIINSAHYTRPYHFWLSAVLAKNLREMGYSEKAVIDAIYRIGLLYELKGNVGTVQADLLLRDYYYLSETRKDLVFNGAGAFWGSRYFDKNLTSKKFINLDEVWAQWVKGENESEPLKSMEEEFYISARIFRPFFRHFLNMHETAKMFDNLEGFMPLRILKAQLH